jgi:hypothetical protein
MPYLRAYASARFISRAATAATMTSGCDFAGVITENGLKHDDELAR